MNLPVDKRTTLGESLAMSKRIREINEERINKQERHKAAETIYWDIWDEYMRLDYNLIHLKPPVPSPPDTEMNPLFVEAICKIEYYKYLTRITPLPESGDMI